MPKEHLRQLFWRSTDLTFLQIIIVASRPTLPFSWGGGRRFVTGRAKSRTYAGRLWTSTKHCRPPTSLRQLQATHLIIYQNPYQLYHLSTRTQHSASTFDIATFDDRHATTKLNHRTSKITFGQIIRMEINDDSIN